MSNDQKPPETIYIGQIEGCAWRLQPASKGDIAYVPKSTHDAEVERLRSENELLRGALREAADHIQAYKDVCDLQQIMQVNSIVLEERKP